MQIGANTESVIRQVGKRKKKREREKFQKIRVSSIVKKIRYFSSKSKPRILTSLSRIVIDDGRIKHRSRDAPAIFKKKRLKKKKTTEKNPDKTGVDRFTYIGYDDSHERDQN